MNPYRALSSNISFSLQKVRPINAATLLYLIFFLIGQIIFASSTSVRLSMLKVLSVDVAKFSEIIAFSGRCIENTISPTRNLPFSDK